MLDSRIPPGDLSSKWSDFKSKVPLVSPANKQNLDIIIIGTGLAGASAASSLAEMGYNVKAFCFQDSPRRAHSIAAQGGINAAKNYQNDGDSVYRLFYDTIKGGDYRSREANVHRLAEVSTNIIDQCVAQGVPFAREYGGTLDNRSFGGVQVSRTFYARGQTGQQLLLGAYSALSRQISKGSVQMYNRHEMLDVVMIDGVARGIIARNLLTGQYERHFGHAVVLATGGYGNVFYLSTNAMGSNVTAAWKAYKKGAMFGNPCFTQIHPTCIPVSGDYQSKLTLMSESLRNDGRIWVPIKKGDTRDPKDIPEDERDYYLERRYPAFGNLVPRDIASRAAKERCDEGYGVGSTKMAVYLDFKDAISSMGEDTVRSRYGNLFQMYNKITGDDPYHTPMRIYPAVHYTMGGLWVDYNLMTSVPGLYSIGESNFSDHGANRLGASALMQGLADGYFVLPYTIGEFLSKDIRTERISTDDEHFVKAEKKARKRNETLLEIKGTKSVESLHRELGKIMWDNCGMSRNEKDLKKALVQIKNLKNSFWSDVFVPGSDNELNTELEKAGRVADFIELGELMIYDALDRNESCGGHFREEYQTEEGEAFRDDENYTFVSAWEFKGKDKEPKLHKEDLDYKEVTPTQRSYK
ncbi:fumarate reductase/succinate dehydrogenase flavoprotein subunit [bacterium]|jgi:succinate dehydrogenase / fumarate reductase flavoprotein subunit|nr:fumarate reductase/succinate dehydrogenase flavoprotein subunit [bacterium]MBT5733189.1 fumarate reductase/succinate dehydrogenase flavoprotein subunit [bacterium]MBT6776951.1 fumarate reductase/succinate dehydrogenase flavoprotein subunit [bacterium]